jgi:hypothetical protein
MRITLSHTKRPDEIKRNIDQGFDEIFKGLPIGAVQIVDEQRTWVGSTLTFSFSARAAFMVIPVKGWILVEEKQVTIEVDLPSFFNQLIPEHKTRTSLEGKVRGLLT